LFYYFSDYHADNQQTVHCDGRNTCCRTWSRVVWRVSVCFLFILIILFCFVFRYREHEKATRALAAMTSSSSSSSGDDTAEPSFSDESLAEQTIKLKKFIEDRQRGHYFTERAYIAWIVLVVLLLFLVFLLSFGSTFVYFVHIKVFWLRFRDCLSNCIPICSVKQVQNFCWLRAFLRILFRILFWFILKISLLILFIRWI
jgi:hypothetical protein